MWFWLLKSLLKQTNNKMRLINKRKQNLKFDQTSFYILNLTQARLSLLETHRHT